jgi:hypothetical protein
LWTTITSGKFEGRKKRKKDGTLYWVDNTIVPFLNKEFKPYQYISIRSDITRKQAEEDFVTLQQYFTTGMDGRCRWFDILVINAGLIPAQH